MYSIPQDITQRLEQPEQAQRIISAYLKPLTPESRKDFSDQVDQLLRLAANAPQKISKITLEVELEAILQTMAKRPVAHATGTVGHGSDDDLSNSFNDKESTFFDPPTWRG